MNKNPQPRRVVARHNKRSYFISSPTNAHTVQKVLLSVLASMQGGRWLHWTHHWKVKGASFVGDHDLFLRLYQLWTNDIDTLAEKIVAMFGPDCVDGHNILAASHEYISRFKGLDCLHLTSLAIEEDFQVTLRTAYDVLKSMNALSLGMDDFIMSMANNHEAYIYQLQQRVADDGGRAGIEKPPYDFSLVGEPK